VTPKPRSAAPRSNAETLLAAQLSQAGILFEREYKFHPSRKWRADFAILYGPNLRGNEDIDVLVEVDGATWTMGRHNHPTSIAKEYERTAAAAILGYRMIRCTTAQVEDGTCLLWIRSALGLEEAA
jgi:very-short-patch-repair endonuclease